MKPMIRILSLAIAAALFGLLIYAADNAVKPVSAKHVCFINKKRFDRNLKSVTVDGKVYYGCCKDCLEKLKTDAASRIDIDPVSGNKVDKATAFIGEDRAGNIYFFESRETMRKFRPAEAVPTGDR